jgi:thiol:disulfide interchange protein DsbA
MKKRSLSIVFGLLAVLGLVGLFQGPAFAQEPYKAGVDYALVSPSQPTSAPAGQVEVRELFWYGCPHCFEFEPLLDNWVKNKPDYVDFKRMPAIFPSNHWLPQAQAFYTAQVLGVLDKVHEPMFHAMHDEHRRMATEEEIAALFAKHGVSKTEFDKAWNSFAVQAKVRRARDMTARYGIEGVPVIIVNGKYRVGGRMARSFDRMLDIVSYLAKKEAAALQSAQ